MVQLRLNLSFFLLLGLQTYLQRKISYYWSRDQSQRHTSYKDHGPTCKSWGVIGKIMFIGLFQQE